MPQRFLIIETSQRQGQVALADGETIVGWRRLEESRRHARDLAPFTQALLDEHACRARDLTAVIVSRGPGSYTGLRVGVMSAKTLAYATGCALLAVDTFAAIARQAPAEVLVLDVLADAQQDNFYLQRFGRPRPGEALQPQWPLEIRPFAAWLKELGTDTWVSGPGADVVATRLPATVQLVAETERLPRAASLLALGIERFRRGACDDPIAVEPLYLRPSSAEEKMAKRP
jgi:tRNA threonylcarbamoyladenosine biosynthesis protein TsaB